MVCLSGPEFSRVTSLQNVQKPSFRLSPTTRIPRYLWTFQLALDLLWLVSQISRLILSISVIGKGGNTRTMDVCHLRKNYMVEQKLKCMGLLGTTSNLSIEELTQNNLKK